MIANFTTSYADGKLVLTDNSTYEDTVVTNRYWIITRADGTQSVNNYPVNSVGNFNYPVEKDLALTVLLAFNYNESTATQGYSKSKNILVSILLSDIIYDSRKKFVDLLLVEDKDEESGKLLNRLELVEAFMESAKTLISSDIASTQQALDMGNDHANTFKCDL